MLRGPASPRRPAGRGRNLSILVANGQYPRRKSGLLGVQNNRDLLSYVIQLPKPRCQPSPARLAHLPASDLSCTRSFSPQWAACFLVRQLVLIKGNWARRQKACAWITVLLLIRLWILITCLSPNFLMCNMEIMEHLPQSSCENKAIDTKMSKTVPDTCA